ncbi:DUF6308 family protein [Nocardioides litoris]|uniref:DUF6308 family protein n=1 Tax=Nocardioides litoris TaxID=1926648 RepID=UPI0011222FB4|nr:DUF6308 family protein [Nocardioides litoris]
MSTALVEEIRLVIGMAGTRLLVEAYFDPTRRFAGATFDLLGDNPANEFTTADVLGASLLDVGFLPRAVRGLLVDERREQLNALLAEIPNNVDLWEATDTDLGPARLLWTAVMGLEGVGPTRTSKLMARKRPRLIPVIDKVVRGALPSLGSDSWLSMQTALRSDIDLRGQIDGLRPESARDISTLRILDAALWMNLSRSTHVARERRRVSSST